MSALQHRLASCSQATASRQTPVRCTSVSRSLVIVRAQSVQTPEPKVEVKNEAEETALKYGLEAGLLKAATSKPKEGGPSRGEQAKQLLKQYGMAYLLTSVSFAAVSFGLCYAAVSAGLDVADLLAKVGLEVNATSEKVGTFAIAYAAHKALSPVRFPPTVALTPVVARWIGKKTEDDKQQ